MAQVSANSMLPKLAGGIVRGMEALRLRGAPTLFRLLSRVPGFSDAVGTSSLGGSRTLRFPAFDPYWARHLWGDEPYEPDVEMIFRRLSPVKDKVLIDCGANIGFWPVTLSDPAYGFTKFVAVEANPALVPLLQENLRKNGIDGEVIHAAVAEQSGQVVHLGGTADHASAKVGDSGIAVETVSLRDLIASASAQDRLIVIKLDIEGCEVPALRGVQGIDETNIVFIYEDWPRSGMPVTAYLLDRGYAAVGVAPTGEASPINSHDDAFRFNRATTAVYGPSNLIGCRPEVLARIETLLR